MVPWIFEVPYSTLRKILPIFNLIGREQDPIRINLPSAIIESTVFAGCGKFASLNLSISFDFNFATSSSLISFLLIDNKFFWFSSRNNLTSLANGKAFRTTLKNRNPRTVQTGQYEFLSPSLLRHHDVIVQIDIMAVLTRLGRVRDDWAHYVMIT